MTVQFKRWSGEPVKMTVEQAMVHALDITDNDPQSTTEDDLRNSLRAARHTIGKLVSLLNSKGVFTDDQIVDLLGPGYSIADEGP